jgi:hypothetical protein
MCRLQDRQQRVMKAVVSSLIADIARTFMILGFAETDAMNYPIAHAQRMWQLT